MRLFILFDRAAASGQSSTLKFGPGSARDREYADWAETEAVALAHILDVLPPELAFDGGREGVRRRGFGQIVFLDQKGIIRRFVPDRGQQV